ncbi:protein of unknown function [Algibacter lectus]|uniref:DUF748 domain-containing protein n=1 Tax=Algibacter lectus TaxID=221126 RepID=UPI0008E61F9A|nr:DUF748 domain-containing protein [Algibacter lectus]SFB84525.1 protein of unknown function [Algibacter lectus]
MPKTEYKTKTIHKKWPQVLLGVAIILLLCLLGLQVYGKYALTEAISDKTPKNVKLTYDDLDINILLGSVEFHNLNLKTLNEITEKIEILATAEFLKITDVAYWPLYKDKRFEADNIEVKNAKITTYKEDTDDVHFSVDELSFNISDVKTDKEMLQNKIPFNYETLDAELQELYLDLSRFEALKVASLSFKENNLKFEDLSIASKYDKEALSKRLTVERDYVDFKVPQGNFEALELGTAKDSFAVSVERFNLNNSELHLYRNKLIADDFTVKTLYGTRLESLPIKLNIESFFIKNANVFYSEKVDLDIDPVSISFEDLDAEMNNVSNTNTEKTDIKVQAKLMGKAPILFNWDFNTKDAADSFNASAVLTDLEAETINPFLESQANVRALGRIHEMYFTIHGNNFKSTGDMKMKYEDFKFSILDEDQLGINKTLSALVNILTNDGSKTDANGYRYGDIAVERDRTKSFFNYLWLNTKDGLKNTVVGNGKK